MDVSFKAVEFHFQVGFTDENIRKVAKGEATNDNVVEILSGGTFEGIYEQEFDNGHVTGPIIDSNSEEFKASFTIPSK